MSAIKPLLLGALLGGISVLLLNRYLPTGVANAPVTAEEQPLYWVAPMDPNFRRDQPGKSPMGMDLVPVYASEQNADSPGTVSISPDIEQSLGVRVAKVSRAPIQSAIATLGYVQFNQDNLTHIHPRVAGWVETLYVKTAGESLKQGDPLYALYSPELVNAQEEYLLAKNRQNQTLINAAQQRLKALQMPHADFVQLQKIGKVLNTLTFTAPQSGVVENLNIREGFYVKPGTTMMSVADLSSVWVEAQVPERQSASLKHGQVATMTLDYLPGQQWQGKVDYLYPSLDPKTRTLRVRLKFNNQEELLKPGMFAAIRIASDDNTAVLQVPREAVIRTGAQDKVVLALGAGKFKSVQVTLGRLSAVAAEIRAGVKVGDQVVVSGQFMLDSESSISSDFRRISHGQHLDIAGSALQPDAALASAVVNHIDPATRRINLTRGAIQKWQRGPATMDFQLDPNLSLEGLQPGASLYFHFVINGGEFVVTDYVLTQQPPSAQLEQQP